MARSFFIFIFYLWKIDNNTIRYMNFKFDSEPVQIQRIIGLWLVEITILGSYYPEFSPQGWHAAVPNLSWWY